MKVSSEVLAELDQIAEELHDMGFHHEANRLFALISKLSQNNNH